MGTLREFSKDTFIYGLGKGIKKFIGFFLLPFYTRALSPSEFGILDTLGSCAFFISTFLNCGLDTASIFYTFQGKDKKEKGIILYTILLLRLITVLPCLILTFFSARISISLFKTPDYKWVVFITCISIPVSLLISEQEYIFRFFRKPWQYNVVTILSSLSGIVFGITLVIVLKLSVLGAASASLLSSFLIFLFSFFTFNRKRYFYHFSWEWAWKLIKFGFPLIWAGLASWVYTASNRFFLLHYKNLDDIGLLSIGQTFSQPIEIINMAVQMSFGVLFFSLYHDETEPDKPKTKKAAIDILYLYLFVSISITLILCIFIIDILKIVTTQKFINGGVTVPFLIFAKISAQCLQLTAIGITIHKKNWHFTWLILLSALLNFGLNFYFIPKFSFLGASFTTFLADFVYFIGAFFVSQYYFKINYNQRKIFTYFALGLIFSLAVPFAQITLNVRVGIIYKLSLLLIGVCLPFILGIMKYKTFSDFGIYLKNKILK